MKTGCRVYCQWTHPQPHEAYDHYCDAPIEDCRALFSIQLVIQPPASEPSWKYTTWANKSIDHQSHFGKFPENMG
jgi:hypothetical protein